MINRIALILMLTFLLGNASALQDAINNAEEGSIIRLSAGVYEGDLVIDKPLTIEGKEKGVIIKGSGEDTVIKISSSYVTLKNLTITNSGSRHDKMDAAIRTEKIKQIEISGCTITDCLYGIDMLMTSNSIIEGNTISSKDIELGLRGDGLRIWYSNNNIIRKNHLVNSRDMVIWYAHGNVIEENSGEYCRYSLHLMHAGQNFIRNNRYRFNSVGIFFMYSKDSIAEGNVVKSSQGATGMGIGMKDVSNFTLKNNTVLYNAQGLYIDRSPYDPDSNNWLENNKILYNAEAIHFHSKSEANIIKNNTLSGNIEDVVNDSADSKTNKNLFEGNYWDGYAGFDRDRDNIGDTSHKIYQYADKLWLYNPEVKFFYGSPVISLLNFLAKLAPFSEPVFLLEDKKPKLREEG